MQGRVVFGAELLHEHLRRPFLVLHVPSLGETRSRRRLARQNHVHARIDALRDEVGGLGEHRGAFGDHERLVGLAADDVLQAGGADVADEDLLGDDVEVEAGLGERGGDELEALGDSAGGVGPVRVDCGPQQRVG